MRLLTFLIPTFLLLACSNEIELGEKSGILFLKDVEVGIDSLEEVPWEVGKEREVEISKGLQFDAQVPKISSNASEALWRRHGVDSWIYRVTKINRGSRQHMGYVAIDSKSAKHIAENFTIHLYYHAASVSREFRRFHCPAFDHRNAIIEANIQPQASRHPATVYVRPGEYVRGDVSRLSFSPLIFSAGLKMQGQYQVEFALFNSKEKRLYSSWTPLAGYINVAAEGAKRVDSCLGIKEEHNPLPGSRAPRIEDLRIR